MQCPKCGKEIANDSQFCEYCGAQIKKKQASTQECLIHVRWFLLLAIVLVSAANPLFLYPEDYENGLDAGPWMLVPCLSLFIVIVSIVLGLKKKLHFVFVILAGIIFCLNLFIVICADNVRQDYLQGEYIEVIVKGDEWHSGCELKSGVDCYAKYHANQIDSLLNRNRIEKHAYVSCVEKKIYPLYEIETVLMNVIFIEALLIILYSLYVFIAYKKGWQY